MKLLFFNRPTIGMKYFATMYHSDSYGYEEDTFRSIIKIKYYLR